MGRHTEFSEEMAEKFCEEIANGANIHKLCSREEYPTKTTIYLWFKQQPQFAAAYAHAREIRGEGRADEVEDIKTQLRSGEVDYNMARILIDAVKWQAGKECPKIYGDKIQQEVTGRDGAPFTVVVSSVLDRD